MLPRLAVAWLLLTLGVLAFGAKIVSWSSMFVEPAVEALHPGFTAIMTGPNGQLGEVGMTFVALQPIKLAGQYLIGDGARMEESVPASQDLLPAVLLLSLIVGWPYRNWREVRRRVALGVAAGIGIFLFTVSMHFAAQFEVILQGYASNIHQAREVPNFMPQYIFVILGGEWLFALLAALAIIRYSARNNKELSQGSIA
jgi:hypothetical protein